MINNSILSLLLVLIGFQDLVYANNEGLDLGEFDKIRADLVCGDKGGAFHLNLKEGLVWQAELNDTEGMPLQVTSFRKSSDCKTCLEIHAQYDLMGQVVYYELKTREFYEDSSRCREKIPVTKMEVRLLKDGDTGHKELVEKWRWTCH